MPLWIIILCLITHWIGDFVAQTHSQSIGKSTSNVVLSEHVFSYTMIWSIPAFIIFSTTLSFCDGFWRFLVFLVITYTTHFAIDYYTSRVNKQLWEAKEVHNFFVSIGFDQVLHYLQIFGTLYLLLK